MWLCLKIGKHVSPHVWLLNHIPYIKLPFYGYAMVYPIFRPKNHTVGRAGRRLLGGLQRFREMLHAALQCSLGWELPEINLQKNGCNLDLLGIINICWVYIRNLLGAVYIIIYILEIYWDTYWDLITPHLSPIKTGYHFWIHWILGHSVLVFGLTHRSPKQRKRLWGCGNQNRNRSSDMY